MSLYEKVVGTCKSLVVLLFAASIALKLLRGATGARTSMDTAIGLGLLGYAVWKIARGLRRLAPRRNPRSHASAPELSARAEWLGRRQEQTRRGAR
jgi:hypothetical protein